MARPPGSAMTLWNYIVEFDVGRLAAEVHVNGWPVCRNYLPKGRITNIKISPWLLEGDNVFQVFVGHPEDDGSPPPEPEPNGLIPVANLGVHVYKCADDERPSETAPMLLFRWVEEAHPLPDEGLELAFEHRFRMEEAFGPYAWEQAMPYAETDRGAVLGVVRQLRDALQARDFDRIVELQRVKLEELGRCAGLDYEGMVQQHRMLFERLIEPGLAVEPFHADDFVLRSGAGGRLVQVERESGDMKAIGFYSSAGVGGSYPVCMSNLGGTWTIVR